MGFGVTETAEILALVERSERQLDGCMVRDRPGIEKILDDLRTCVARQQSPRPGTLEKLEDRITQSISKAEARRRLVPDPSFPASLPVSERCEEIVRAIQDHQVVVIAGETGSGKTTQIPKMCLAAGRGIFGMVGCTQPRRVAALSISRRVSEELETKWGGVVGCKIRFNDETSDETLVKFMTDGMLLAEAQGDPWLGEYDTLIIDEAHERSLNIDFILGYLRLLLKKRPDLKVIITSATIDTVAFSKAFDNAPIIEVSGKVYPVEVIYHSLEEQQSLDPDYTYIEGAVDAVGTLLYDPVPGDILVFMPGERDIRETRDQMEARYGHQLDVLPLFGRMSSGDQERIFSEGLRRRVIIATNIAETSITIPNIRFVVDSGMARVSRFSPRTRTKRLPIEGISQSSANQRRGRCGRVADGVCIRLYSEEEFNERPAYTQPELQRCNLAEVILRMKAFGLGDVETFPFLNPPQDNAIKNGYRLLQELGALDEGGDLTQLGHRLARLPLDPMIGRMVIQANEEHALREVLVIAAGLSIQDPRDRPMEQEKQADAAHQVFKDQYSDFITLLNLWNLLDEQSSKLKSQGQVRKFCRRNFISYLRYREWRDIHTQLRQTLREIGGFEFSKAEATHDAIHRSILTGLLVQTGTWVEKNWYKSPGNRKVMVFPGSVLFQSMSARERKLARKAPAPVTQDRSGQPRWIVAGEFVETSQLFARNVGRIRPEWIVELGGYLCNFSYIEPWWDSKGGRVLVKERVTLKGLEVLTRSIDFGRIHPQDATEIFIREALVAEDLRQHYPFLEHNRNVVEQVQTWQRRVRDLSLSNLDERIYEFYASRFRDVVVSSEHDFNRCLKDWLAEDAAYLHLKVEDLTKGTSLAVDSHQYPEALTCLGHRVEIEYAYSPGESGDGVTIRLPAALSDKVSPSILEWLVPGYRREKVENLIRLLPRNYRKDLQPTSTVAARIAGELKPASTTLGEDLSLWVMRYMGVDIPADAWPMTSLPEYLQVKVAVVDKKGHVHYSGKDIREFRKILHSQSAALQKEKIFHTIKKLEKYSLTRWDFGDLPEEVEVDSPGGATVWLYPGIHLENNEVHVRVFRSLSDAMTASVPAWRRLAAMAMEKDMLWMERDLHGLEEISGILKGLTSVDALVGDATEFCLRVLFPAPETWPLQQSRFQARVSVARAQAGKLGKKVVSKVIDVMKMRQEILSQAHSFPAVMEEVRELVPADFLRRMTGQEGLQQLPRSLKARKIRLERALINPSKDTAKWDRVRPWKSLSGKWSGMAGLQGEALTRAREFSLLVEEYYISIFAQELGTQIPVSENRLKQYVEDACRDGYLRRA